MKKRINEMPYKSEKVKLPKKYDRRVKLSDDDKNKIREEYSLGNTSWRKLAQRYQVSPRLIGTIVNEKSLENMRKYNKTHWKEFQHSKEERRVAIRNTRKYKHELYKKGLI